MTRRFLALLGVAAQAQTQTPIAITCGSSDPKVCEDIARKAFAVSRPVHYIPKPANGECPVCGTVAPKYDRKEAAAAINAIGPCTGSRGSSTVCRDTTPEQVSAVRQVACAHCRVVFEQTSEDVKP